MKVEFILTLQDYKAALKLDIRRKPLTHSSNLVNWFVLLLAFFLIQLISPHVVHENWFQYLFAFLIILVLLLPVHRSKKIRRQFNAFFPPGVTENVSIDINDEYVIVAIPGHSERKFFWNAILEFAQDEKATLLYVANSAFVFIPTTALSASQRVELATLITRHAIKR